MADMVIHRYTYLALKIHFALTFFADYSMIDSYTYSTYIQADAPVQVYIIYIQFIYMLQSYLETHI